MLMTTVIAVALGFAPVNLDGSVQATADNYASLVGPVSETIDRAGKHHLRGFNRLNGAGYEVTVDRDGNVEAVFGEQYITFRVRHA
jgi:hypothetical protein